MNYNPLHIALVLFTRTPAEEVQHKKLVPHGTPEQQYKVASTLIQHSQEKLSATGLPYFVFSSEQQTGISFGDRLYNVFAHLFSLGYQQVIAIGNDCPELNSADILSAAQQLPAKDVILGPDKSGGIYLLGLTSQEFRRYNSFAGIRWNTPAVLADALSFFLGQTTPFILPVKFLSIDNSRDLKKFLQKSRNSSPIYLYLKQLLRQVITYTRQTGNCGFTQFNFTFHLFRGPPSSASLAN